MTASFSQLSRLRSRRSAATATRSKHDIKKKVARVLVLIGAVTPSHNLDIEETDDELCSEHMSYKPCRTCAAQAQVDRYERSKEA